MLRRDAHPVWPIGPCGPQSLLLLEESWRYYTTSVYR
jgi:hypothetical protein